MNPTEVKKNSLAAWLMCCRPKTWAIALCPVFVGLAFSFWELHRIHWPIAIATALLSILMQAITNMENDAAYTKRKADRTDRKGLPRATSLGLLTVTAVERAILFLAFLVALDTLYLLYEGGWVIVVISICSVVAAYVYMGGPKPLAYTPLSELICFIFFGLVAVCGTFYLQTKTFSLFSFFAGCAVGFLATAVLVVNNYRDIAHDASVNRTTLAVVLGERKTACLYTALIYAPFVVCLILVALDMSLWPILGTLVFFFNNKKLSCQLRQLKGNDLNAVLFATVKFELRFSILFSLLILAAYFLH